MKNKTVKALALAMAVATVTMMGSASIYASDDTAEAATEETADTEEYKYHAGAENGCSTGRKAFRIGRIYLQTGKRKDRSQ